MNWQVLRVIDLRSTLMNLKYLMFYLTMTMSGMLPPLTTPVSENGDEFNEEAVSIDSIATKSSKSRSQCRHQNKLIIMINKNED